MGAGGRAREAVGAEPGAGAGEEAPHPTPAGSAEVLAPKEGRSPQS